jgi:hypothetical protein
MAIRHYDAGAGADKVLAFPCVGLATTRCLVAGDGHCYTTNCSEVMNLVEPVAEARQRGTLDPILAQDLLNRQRL